MVKRSKKQQYNYGLKDIKAASPSIDLTDEQMGQLDTGFSYTKFVRRGMEVIEIPRSKSE